MSDDEDNKFINQNKVNQEFNRSGSKLAKYFNKKEDNR